ncbi:MAG: 5-formyltetrahydrofolate cyclo-ligase [Sulfuritalea sp.]|nr:5-formyltetrahydrofolate cyclo-ligase [Sulfuritalea sp.]MDP1983788.1 5-formyltetrahydrofolate cyclo-ligase [Sulfuritalea sp.]
MGNHLRSGEHIADSTIPRAALRREKLAARMALDEKTLADLAARIEAHLAKLLAPLPPQTLAFCAPVRGEFDARPLASRLIGRGWRAAMPIVIETNAPMRFRQWTPASTMGVDRYDIPIPLEGADLVPDVVLLPLLAFDAQGFRLGYGGGYFDRTLAALVPRPLAIGIGYELGRVADIRPQTHDIPVAAIVTEAGILRFK